MCVVYQAVEDGVGAGGLVDDIVPCLDRKRAGDDRRSGGVAILDDFHQVAALAGGQAFGSPVVQDQQVGLHELSEEAREPPVTMGEFEVGEEA
jgi:hypothetical protein